jgi:AAA15 family ATPase/GTPase
MNEKLIVKNFGPIKEAELELKKVTVFIGPQGSGKSTLAKLVAICKDGERSFLRSEPVPVSYNESYYGLKSFKSENSFFSFSSNIFELSNIGATTEIVPTELGDSLLKDGKIINEKLNVDLASQNLDDLSKERSRFDANLEYSRIFYQLPIFQIIGHLLLIYLHLFLV